MPWGGIGRGLDRCTSLGYASREVWVTLGQNCGWSVAAGQVSGGWITSQGGAQCCGMLPEAIGVELVWGGISLRRSASVAMEKACHREVLEWGLGIGFIVQCIVGSAEDPTALSATIRRVDTECSSCRTLVRWIGSGREGAKTKTSGGSGCSVVHMQLMCEFFMQRRLHVDHVRKSIKISAGRVRGCILSRIG